VRYVLFVAVGVSFGALAACGDDAAPAEVCTGGWHVCDGHLRDRDGRAVILRGMNVGKKEAPYIDFHTEADFARMRTEWGMNSLRLYFTWAAVEPTQGVYDDAYLDGVRTRLDWAAAHGIDVVLDLHQDVYGEGFGFDGAPRWTCDEARYAAFQPSTPWPVNYLDPNVKACFDELWTDPAKGEAHAAVWRHIALRLGDHPAVIGFDPINEPHWGSGDVFTFERDRLQAFYDRDVAAIRAVAPHWVAFLEPGSNRNIGLPTTLAPFAYDDVVYAPHAYDAAAETGQGFDAERRRAFVDNVAALRSEADALGTALWIGEYGGLGTDPGIGAYMDAAYDAASAVGASSMYWAYSNNGGYSVLDADGNEIAPIMDAIVRPYPSRIAGTLLDWTHDEVARTLTVRYRPDLRITAPTEIIVPPRIAAVPTVACDGCTAEQVGDNMIVTTPSTPDTDGVATITLSLD
jgi:endoglycosylceramidase